MATKCMYDRGPVRDVCMAAPNMRARFLGFRNIKAVNDQLSFEKHSLKTNQVTHILLEPSPLTELLHIMDRLILILFRILPI